MLVGVVSARSTAIRRPIAATAILTVLMAGSHAAVQADTAAGPAARPGPPTSAEVAAATREFGPEAPARAARRGAIAPLPLDGSRVVSLYGAPQLTKTVIGRNSVSGATRKLERRASAFERRREPPVLPAFDIIASIATADSGRDGLYRSRQSNAVLDAYQRGARRLGGRLVLDIQPGRARIADELRAFKDRIQTEGVDVAIDPEWNVGPRGVPGRTTGRVNAAEVNRAARLLARWSASAGLGPKLLVVHQFREGSIAGRGKIREPDGVDVVLNFDGIGSPAAKRAGYEALSSPRLETGFSLFLKLDSGLMRPAQVTALDPAPRYVMYQ